MRIRSDAEKLARSRQAEMLAGALERSARESGVWMNKICKPYPKFLGNGVRISPWNAMVLALHSDQSGYRTNLYTTLSGAMKLGPFEAGSAKGAPYVCNMPKAFAKCDCKREVISKVYYERLSEVEQRDYEPFSEMVSRVLFNLDQTSLREANEQVYKATLDTAGKGLSREELANRVSALERLAKEHGVDAAQRYDGDTEDSRKADDGATLQEIVRLLIGRLMDCGYLPRIGSITLDGREQKDEDLCRQILVTELASGVKMLELGYAARLAEASMALITAWTELLRVNALFLEQTVKDVDRAVDILSRMERGETVKPMDEIAQAREQTRSSQVELLAGVLRRLSPRATCWLNKRGKAYPRVYPDGEELSPFAAMLMALTSDRFGFSGNRYMTYEAVTNGGYKIRQRAIGVMVNCYEAVTYEDVARTGTTLSRKEYLALPARERAGYRTVKDASSVVPKMYYNLDETTLEKANPKEYALAMAVSGMDDQFCGRSLVYVPAKKAIERVELPGDEQALRERVNNFFLKVQELLVPIRVASSGESSYDAQQDIIYMNAPEDHSHFYEYAQDLMRQAVSATGHASRLARSGVTGKHSSLGAEDLRKREQLLVELASGVMMIRWGLPGQVSAESLALTDFWIQELREDPAFLHELETGVDDAVAMLRCVEHGQRIEQRDTKAMSELTDDDLQEASGPALAPEVSRLAQLRDRLFVLIEPSIEAVAEEKIETPSEKFAEVILPTGAALDEDRERSGLEKPRIVAALAREGKEMVTFYNSSGKWSYIKADNEMVDKKVSVARLIGHKIDRQTQVDTVAARPAEGKLRFVRTDLLMTEDERCALYLQVKGEEGFSIYLSDVDVYRLFTAVKDKKSNVEDLRDELAEKYYRLGKEDSSKIVDLFKLAVPAGFDLGRVEKVTLRRDEEGELGIQAVVDGRETDVRKLSQVQYKGLFLAKDREEYKKQLVAVVFGDVCVREAPHAEQMAAVAGAISTDGREGEPLPVQDKQADGEVALPMSVAWAGVHPPVGGAAGRGDDNGGIRGEKESEGSKGSKGSEGSEVSEGGDGASGDSAGSLDSKEGKEEEPSAMGKEIEDGEEGKEGNAGASGDEGGRAHDADLPAEGAEGRTIIGRLQRFAKRAFDME